MKILMKSALKKKELLARKALNENNIEIQLFEDFCNEEISLIEYFNTIISSGLNICVIHTPLVNGEAIEIDRFYEKRKKSIFLKPVNYQIC